MERIERAIQSERDMPASATAASAAAGTIHRSNNPARRAVMVAAMTASGDPIIRTTSPK